MTTHKGIAAVTQTLGYLLGAVVREAVPEAHVTLKRPEETSAGASDEPRLNIYLVQVLTEATMRSNDLPTRANGALVKEPQAPVNLRYLLSFFGAWEKAHLMLGAAEIALRARPLLDAAIVGEALREHHHLQDSGLAEQQPPVRLVPGAIGLEELTRFWSGFVQMPYTLSTVYEARTVLLTESQELTAALPVRRVNSPVTGMPPQLDSLPRVDFVPSATMVPATGRGLSAGLPIDVDGRWTALESGPRGLQFALPAGTPAGPHGVRVGRATADGPVLVPGSAAQVLVVCPDLERVVQDAPGGPLTITLAPALQPGQQVVLSLVDPDAGADAPVASARITATATQASSTLQFRPPSALAGGTYLAQVEVDGAASQPTFADGRFSAPLVEIRV